jgi:small-conductance mechanosensitive channel
MAIPAETWTKIAGGIVGVILLGLQGVNLSEVTTGNENGSKRMQLLEQLLVISRDMEKALENQTKILENGAEMLNRDEASLKNQGEIILTLKKAIDERRDLLQQNLEEMKKGKREGP